MNKDHLATLKDNVAPYRKALIDHDVYEHIRSLEDLRIFMENHVYAVWDFMSLLKALQQKLTCVDVPWLPTAQTLSRRLVNEIVLGEESDVFSANEYASHYEIYRAAMVECEANVNAIDLFLELLRRGAQIPEALNDCGAPEPASRFVKDTWRFLESDKVHIIAAAFTFGREDVIPDMFRAFVADLSRNFPGRLDLFRLYLERHIDVDEDRHGPMSLRMIQELCGDDESCWEDATQAVIDAIRARIDLWSGIVSRIEERRQAVTHRRTTG